MRLALLDTNVLVSVGIKPGSGPARIVTAALRGEIQLVVCPAIAAEYRAVMLYARFARDGFPPFWIEFLIDSALKLPDGIDWPHSLPDPDDAKFLSLAKQTGAWLVTGNLKHYPRDARDGVTILSPAEYAETL
jgi:predicted nucleic acid-binding protein